MREEIEVLLKDLSEARDIERTTRGFLHGINGFAVAVVSGLLVGITQYKIKILLLAAPLIFFQVGYFFSGEALRLLRVTEYARRVEGEIRQRLGSAGIDLPPGLEDSLHPGAGLRHFLHFNSSMGAAALFHGIFFAMFLWFAATSPYPRLVRGVVLGICFFLGAVIWGLDLWRNRYYFGI